jgi:hypothetical protein
MVLAKKKPAIKIKQKNRTPKVTPIERIFAKLVGRKMTPAERRYFHLKPKAK